MLLGVVWLALSTPLGLSAQEESGGMLSVEPTRKPEKTPTVTAVYGVSADDYLPSQEIARKQLRPGVRSRKTRPQFNLPDAFYFIGGPIFLFLFLRVLVIFLNGFEEKRKEELRTVAREVWDAD